MIKEGKLFLQLKSKLRTRETERFVQIQSGSLLFHKTTTVESNPSHIPLEHAIIQAKDGSDVRFTVEVGGESGSRKKTFILRAGDLNERKEWLEALKQASTLKKCSDLTNLAFGTVVELSGLKAGAKYNGKLCTICGPCDANKGRYPVKLESGNILSIALKNIQMCDAKISSKIKQSIIPGLTAKQAEKLIDTHNIGPTRRAIHEIQQISLNAAMTDKDTWRDMEEILTQLTCFQMESSKFKFNPKVHRLPEIFPYDYNAMTGYVGSWMGDGCGLTQWPMDDKSYMDILRNIVVENNVGLIIGLLEPGPEGEKEASNSYWKELGLYHSMVWKEGQADYFYTFQVTGIPYPPGAIPNPSNTAACEVVILLKGPYRNSPFDFDTDFEFLFKKMQAMEKSQKRFLIHGMGATGRGALLRLMYMAWKKTSNA